MLVDKVFEESKGLDLEKVKAIQLPLAKQVEALYKGTHALQLFAQNVTIPVLQGQLSLAEHETPIVATYYCMYGHMRSLVVLNSHAHLQAVAAATRSLFELLLDLKALVAEASLAPKYHAFVAVERFRAAEGIVEFLTTNPLLDKGVFQPQFEWVNNPLKRQEAEALVEHHWGRTKKGGLRWPDHWSGKRVSERAKDAGPEYEHIYRSSYPQLSWYTHTGPAGYFGISEAMLQTMFGLFHSLVHKLFLEATTRVGDRFFIFKAEPSLRGKLEEVRLTPGAALLESKMAILRELEQRGPTGAAKVGGAEQR